jgi:hypothetical protein
MIRPTARKPVTTKLKKMDFSVNLLDLYIISDNKLFGDIHLTVTAMST